MPMAEMGATLLQQIPNAVTSPAPETTPGVSLLSADWILISVSKIGSAYAELQSNSSEFLGLAEGTECNEIRWGCIQEKRNAMF